MTLTDGLVAYYGLDGNAQDLGGNGNDGTVNGAAETTDSIIGTAMSFDGVDDYINVPAGLVGSKGTISVWVKSNDVNNDGVIFDNTKIGVSDYLMIRQSGSTAYRFIVADESIYYSTTVDTNWHHIVLTWDSTTTWKVYFDNTLVITGSSGKDPTSAYSSFVGANGDGDSVYGYYYNGIIDELAIYNRALSESEISELYNSGAGKRPPMLGLVAYYTLGGDAIDSSGNNNHGTVYGATVTTNSIIGNAIYFDGVDDYIDTSQTLFNDLTAFTISGWFNIHSFNSTYTIGSVIAQYGPTTYSVQLSLANQPNTGYNIRFSVYNGSALIHLDYNKGSNFNTDEWHHVVAVYDGSSMKLYLDGIQVGSVSQSGSVYSHTTTAKIGYYERSGNYLDGSLDEIGIWNRALIDSEIADLYNSGSGKRPDILKIGNKLYYSFDDSTATDLSGNLNDGTVYGSPTASGSFGNISTGLSLDGSGQYVTAPNSSQYQISGGNSVTVSFWAKITSFSEYDRLIHYYNSSGSSPGYQLWLNSTGTLRGYVQDGTNTYYGDTSTAINDSSYHMITYKINPNSTSYIYIDNVESASFSTNPLNDVLPSEDFYIFNANFLGADPAGEINDFVIYNRPLANDEISELYNGGLGLNPYSTETPTASGLSNKIIGMTASKVNGIDVTAISKINGI